MSAPPPGPGEQPPAYTALPPGYTVPGQDQAKYQGNYQEGAPLLYGQQGTPAGYQPGVPAGYQALPPQQPYGQGPANVIITQPHASVVVVGGCPACRVGVLENDFTCLGVCCAIFFFPIGLLCCLAMRQRRCPNCGAIFG